MLIKIDRQENDLLYAELLKNGRVYRKTNLSRHIEMVHRKAEDKVCM